MNCTIGASVYIFQDECPLPTISHNNNFHDSIQASTSQWLTGLGSVTLISLLSILGAVLLPFLQKLPYVFEHTMLFLVSMSVSALSGAAVLVLAPEGLGLQSCINLHWKNVTVCLGIFTFYVIQRILTAVFKIGSTLPAHAHGTEVEKNIEVSGSFLQQVKTMKSVAWLVLIGDAFHNFLDGVALGTTFVSIGVKEGWTITIAIFAEEFPHELGDFAILMNSGLTLRNAIICNLVSASIAVVGFFFGALLGEEFFGTYIFSWMAGVFLFISLGSMLPEVEATIVKIQKTYKETFKPAFISILGLATGYAIVFSCLFVF